MRIFLFLFLCFMFFASAKASTKDSTPEPSPINLYKRSTYKDSNIVEKDIMDLYKVKYNGKYGYVTDREVVIPAIYDEIGKFRLPSSIDTAYFSMTYFEYIKYQKGNYTEALNHLQKRYYEAGGSQKKKLKAECEMLERYTMPDYMLTTWVRKGGLHYNIDINGDYVLLYMPINKVIDEIFWDYE